MPLFVAEPPRTGKRLMSYWRASGIQLNGVSVARWKPLHFTRQIAPADWQAFPPDART